MAIQSLNPATEELVRRFSPHDSAYLENALQSSVSAHSRLRSMSFADRAQCMLRLAEILERDKQRLAAIATMEMGKTLSSAVKEVEKCAWVCRYYADNAEQFLADDDVPTDAQRSYRRYLPIGPILAVMPWNFPYWQVFRCLAPALMAGNTLLLKHASNVPQCALAIEEACTQAGFDSGAMQTLLIGSDKVAAILDDSRVRAATLTGSGPAGAAVAARAGQNIKKTVLELGGSDPFIVMPSADMEAAVSAAVQGRVQNAGQSCIAAKRFIVHREIYAEFSERFAEAMTALNVGDPTADATDVGPLATASGRDECASLVKQFLARGARRIAGAQAIEGTGFFYQPGVIEVPREKAHEFSDEVFGPVALLIQAKDIDDAIALGNDSPFGLGSAIFTQDNSDIKAAVDRLDAGSTFVNAIVASHPALPFGGVKQSGYGRELSHEGIREFVNLKTVYLS